MKCELKDLLKLFMLLTPIHILTLKLKLDNLL